MEQKAYNVEHAGNSGLELLLILLSSTKTRGILITALVDAHRASWEASTSQLAQWLATLQLRGNN